MVLFWIYLPHFSWSTFAPLSLVEAGSTYLTLHDVDPETAERISHFQAFADEPCLDSNLLLQSWVMFFLIIATCQRKSSSTCSSIFCYCTCFGTVQYHFIDFIISISVPNPYLKFYCNPLSTVSTTTFVPSLLGEAWIFFGTNQEQFGRTSDTRLWRCGVNLVRHWRCFRFLGMEIYGSTGWAFFGEYLLYTTYIFYRVS